MARLACGSLTGPNGPRPLFTCFLPTTNAPEPLSLASSAEAPACPPGPHPAATAIEAPTTSVPTAPDSLPPASPAEASARPPGPCLIATVFDAPVVAPESLPLAYPADSSARPSSRADAAWLTPPARPLASVATATPPATPAEAFSMCSSVYSVIFTYPVSGYVKFQRSAATLHLASLLLQASLLHGVASGLYFNTWAHARCGPNWRTFGVGRRVSPCHGVHF